MARPLVVMHVTLFHALPPHLLDDAEAQLSALSAIRPFPVQVTEVSGLGRGVAYRLASEEASRLQVGWVKERPGAL